MREGSLRTSYTNMRVVFLKKNKIMADNNIKNIKMSEQNIPGESRSEATHKASGRKTAEKPQRALYRPRSGMTIKRSEPSSSESWRSCKSPSPSAAELQARSRHSQNRQVESNINDSKEKELKINCTSTAEDKKNLDEQMNELTITTHVTQVIDLTISPNPSIEEKKKVKKPEQAIYVPKAAQEQKPKLDWAAQVEEFSHEEELKSDKNKVKKKPKRRNGDELGRGSDRNLNRSEEEKSLSNAKTDSRDVRQNSTPRFPPTTGRVAPPPRGRDSRSMEHGWSGGQDHGSWSGDRYSSKPPNGRKNAPTLNIDTLPPRLKKKYLEEKGMSYSHIGMCSEEPWDGGSLSYSSHHQPAAPPKHWTNTVPPPRGRGRGRGKFQESFNERRPGENWKNGEPRTNWNETENDINGVGKHSEDYEEHVPIAPSKSKHTEESWKDGRTFSARTKTNDDLFKDDPKSGTHQHSSTSGPLNNQRSDPSSLSEGDSLKVTISAPLIALHSTPEKKMNWSEIVEATEEQMSRSSSLNSLNQHTFPLPTVPPRSRDKKRRRGKERSHSRDSAGHNSRRRDRRTSEESSGRGSSRDRNKGHYGFHGPSSRETSRERTDWRRSGSSGIAGGGSGDDKKEENWRKAGSEDRVNWRAGSVGATGQSSGANSSSSTPLTASAAATATPSAIASAHVPSRGFIHIPPTQQRQLFDPNNPGRPILVSSSNARPPVMQSSLTDHGSHSAPSLHHMTSIQGYPVASSDPGLMRAGYQQPHHSLFMSTTDKSPEPMQRSVRHLSVLKNIEAADMDVYYTLGEASRSGIQALWPRLNHARKFLQQTLLDLLCTDIKFCLTEHIEQSIWRSTYYGLIEFLKTSMVHNPANKEFYRSHLVCIVDEGFQFFDNLIKALEDTYKFKLDEFLTDNGSPEKGVFIGMAVNMAQKLLLCLGDLARYKEYACDSANYVKAKSYYLKAQVLNPRNGRTYYQLATIAFSGKRKLDAVYYYMRSLMASQPFPSAKESLTVIFDDLRKKADVASRAKVEERVTDKERREVSGPRREIWIHPLGGRRRVHRTTSTSDARKPDSDDEDLSLLAGVDINRRFTFSFLLVHGKIFTKIGMESFQQAAVQMLKEFRALLQQRPLPVNSTRFLQLTALNIFSIEHTKLKDAPGEQGYRSAVQVNALIVSLQMLNLMLERSLMLLEEQLAQDSPHLHEDLLLLLPAIKIWCDWLLTHAGTWNPPPCCNDFRVGSPGDCWTRLASLVNFLEENTFWKVPIVTKNVEGYLLVKLPEDSALYGFSPLMVCDQDQVYTPPDTEMEAAQNCLRFRKILFFATEFLCGIEPPVLKLKKEEDRLAYISLVNTPGPSPTNPAEDDQSDTDILVESFSEGEDSDSRTSQTHLSSSEHSDSTETGRLLQRKEFLERRHQRQERQRRRMMALLEKKGLSVDMEVRPKYLVPDTNCFIDYLAELKMIASTTGPHSSEPLFILSVPLIVVTELEGISRGGKHRDMSSMSLKAQAHSMTVAEDAREALAFLRLPAKTLTSVRCVTASGKVINSFTPFSVDGEVERNVTNDDKILETCLSLCRHSSNQEFTKPGETRRLKREVVLLTEDRNLRLKAHTKDVPAREVRDFIQWAELG